MPKSTRDTIVQTAKDMFYHRGYGATSYGDIAKETGIAKGNIQYYFKTKESLLFATLELRAQRIESSLRMWETDPDPKARIGRFIDMLDRMADDLSRYGCPVGTLSDELGKADQPARAHARALFDLYLNWLEKRFDALLPAPQSREAAEHLLTMAQGASLLAHSYHDPTLVTRQTRAMRAWLERI